jgi:hypothetical protein
MSDTPKGRGVVDSIRALRERRYNEYGPGAKRAPAKPSVEELRATVAKIPAKKAAKKKAKKSKKRSRK